jgi:hypothetical protein
VVAGNGGLEVDETWHMSCQLENSLGGEDGDSVGPTALVVEGVAVDASGQEIITR